jgi:hypothetical protein
MYPNFCFSPQFEQTALPHIFFAGKFSIQKQKIAAFFQKQRFFCELFMNKRPV